MDFLHYKKFYVNPKTGHAMGIVCRENTASFGNCNIVEVALPGVGGMLIPQKINQPMTGWLEITKEQFVELQRTYVAQAVERQRAGTAKGKVKSWLRKMFRRKS